MFKSMNRTQTTFWVIIGAIMSLNMAGCGEKTAPEGTDTSVEATTETSAEQVKVLENVELLEVIKNSTKDATYIFYGNKTQPNLIAYRDGENFQIDFVEYGAGDGELYSQNLSYINDVFYTYTVSGSGEPEGALRLVGGGEADRDSLQKNSTLIDTITTREEPYGGVESLAQILRAEELSWEDLEITTSECKGLVCTYEMAPVSGVYDGSIDIKLLVETEVVESVPRLTRVEVFWADTVLEVKYAKQTIKTPETYTDENLVVFLTFSKNEAEATQFMNSAGSFFEEIVRWAEKAEQPISSREFWDSFLKNNKFEGISLFVAIPEQPGGAIHELVGPTSPYTEIPENLGMTFKKVTFVMDEKYACLDLEKGIVIAGFC